MRGISVYFSVLILILYGCNRDYIFDHDDNLSLNQNIQKLADKYVEHGLPGIVLLIDHPTKGYHILESGASRIEDAVPLTKHYLFHSASLMKTYTAVCVMQLEESCLLKLEDKIMNHLPDSMINKIPNGRSATIKSLLNHTSGIPDFVNQVEYINDLIEYANEGPAPMEELEYIKNLSADFDVGCDTQYSNTGYYILQHVVSEVANQPFEVYLNDNIIQTINLKNTFYKNLPQAVNYVDVADYYIDWDNNGDLSNSSDLENRATQTFEGYGGLIATIEDYYLFLKGLFVDKSLISQVSIDKMKEVSHSNRFGYGQGLEVVLSSKYPDKYGHKGGTQASFFYYPQENTFVLSMVNYSFNGGDSPIDEMAMASDEICETGNLLGEIELCLFN